MPELPEIETICKALRAQILNKVIIQAIKITNLSLRKPISDDLIKKLVNIKVIDIQRRAKYIKICLNDNSILLIHLGMSGKILIKPRNYIYQKHDHVAFILNDGQQLVYNDPRRFGLIEFLSEDNNSLTHLGIEPLEQEFTPAYLANILNNKKQPVKLSIMDNSNIVGIGNIYACESLFLSKVKPDRPSFSLSKKEIVNLHKEIIFVLEEAIKQGGSSLKDYASVSGEKGYFQHFFKVYGREGGPCSICHEAICKVKQGGRSSFYCPSCQK
jgi:formamidopyrimidine-DNA glycosylase